MQKNIGHPGRIAAVFSALTLAAIFCVACSAGSLSEKPRPSEPAAANAGAPIKLATFAPLPAGSGGPFGATSMNLAAKGYVEEEFLASGSANRYRIKDPLKTAEVVDSGHAYTTRILVRRPTRPSKFNGVVVVEWFNVTGNQDMDFVFGAVRNDLIDRGYAWVGVSAQLAGANALKPSNPARYSAINLAASNIDPVGGGALDDRSDVLAWDIYTQIGAALRTRGAVDPLGGLKPKLVIAAGESQSALRLTNYYNAIHPLYPSVFDGFFLYDRLIGGFRTDLHTKLLSFGSEVVRSSFGAAPADNDNLRVWEVAGAAHLSDREIPGYMDEQFLRNGVARAPDGTKLSMSQTFVGCTNTPIWSRVPNGDVLSAGLEALIAWVSQGKAPPHAARLGGDPDGKLARDSEGRVSGGIRLAAYDAPMSKNLGVNAGPSFCSLAGSHQDFSPAEMCRRYGSPENYVAKVTEVSRKAQSDGFLLAVDADRTIQEAKGVAFSCPAPVR